MTKRSFLYYDEMDSPLGPLTLISTEKGLCRIDFGSVRDTEPKLTSWSRKYFLKSEWIRNEQKHQVIKQQLNEYFSENRKTFDVPLDLYGTPFQQTVWKALADIPYGETRSYKDISLAIQAPKAIRAVGGAINKNPLSIVFPCHRVIGSNGALVGYAGGLDKKEHLLQHEHAIAVSS
ncbi:methylated-DNA--[protein]-cysteine S-methyltransferase [Pontibacillus yanchengensis]|uniref:Methylated-DNA--protein-cysteine methyltransferase n=1 Tax=Pontibacillus yanchengensis Y32 TaxID=1385514 RepID=A0A0A2TA02_9BACI|nr:methylated-DNA--[protein]-cysteine S-methyltransferase [Pontibacillus yanchengensis]KGP71248.1 [Fe-S]-binding protein [Pontibacillus yanchengensis Y32]